MTDLTKLSKKALLKELESVEEHIDVCSYGKYELYLRDAIYKEIDRRGLTVRGKTAYTFE